MRLSFNQNGKIGAYLAVYDTYNLVDKQPTTSSNDETAKAESSSKDSGNSKDRKRRSGMLESVDKLCSTMSVMSNASGKASPEAEQALGMEVDSLFADKIDCSDVPFNPVIGYDLKGVSYKECNRVFAKGFAKDHDKITGMTGAHCIEKIIDEDEHLAAVFWEFHWSTKTGQVVSTHAGMRLSFNQNGKIGAYHAVYDTYNILN